MGSFELHGQVNAIQMCTHNICLYREVYKKDMSCNIAYCAFIGACAVIRSDLVYVVIITSGPSCSKRH